MVGVSIACLCIAVVAIQVVFGGGMGLHINPKEVNTTQGSTIPYDITVHNHHSTTESFNIFVDCGSCDYDWFGWHTMSISIPGRGQGQVPLDVTPTQAGSYSFVVRAFLARGLGGTQAHQRAQINVTNVPPASITNLTNVSYAPTYIYWTWDDPVDADFSHVMVYLDGISKPDVPKGTQFYNATNLDPDTSYEIGTHTVDETGNVNETWINHTAETKTTDQPPQWSNPQTNKTLIRRFDYVKFTTDWTDDTGLSGYVFSINQTGAWVNSSFTDFSSISNTSENITQITAPNGTTVEWRFYANDTSDKWNKTEIQSFVVQPAQFMIYGWVFYENGSACNNPIVNITNLNVSLMWPHVEEIDNYYKLNLTPGIDINESEVLLFDVKSPDAVPSNITIYRVTKDDINVSGLFPFNITLNYPPTCIALLMNLTPPRLNGTAINWTAYAYDPGENELWYRFSLQGPGTNNSLKTVQDWNTSNYWIWETDESDKGVSIIYADVRDCHHANNYTDPDFDRFACMCYWIT